MVLNYDKNIFPKYIFNQSIMNMNKNNKGREEYVALKIR